jgi:hypothetical protein
LIEGKRNIVPISIRVAPQMPTRPCRFCLALQDDSVFADFDVDGEGLVYLRMISFDGYGACGVPPTIKRMPTDDSRSLLGMIENGTVNTPAVEEILRTYFRQNMDVIWPEALHEHGMLG